MDTFKKWMNGDESPKELDSHNYGSHNRDSPRNRDLPHNRDTPRNRDSLHNRDSRHSNSRGTRSAAEEFKRGRELAKGRQREGPRRDDVRKHRSSSSRSDMRIDPRERFAAEQDSKEEHRYQREATRDMMQEQMQLDEQLLEQEVIYRASLKDAIFPAFAHYEKVTDPHNAPNRGAALMDKCRTEAEAARFLEGQINTFHFQMKFIPAHRHLQEETRELFTLWLRERKTDPSPELRGYINMVLDVVDKKVEGKPYKYKARKPAPGWSKTTEGQKSALSSIQDFVDMDCRIDEMIDEKKKNPEKNTKLTREDLIVEDLKRPRDPIAYDLF